MGRYRFHQAWHAATCDGTGQNAALPCYYLTFDGSDDVISLAGVTFSPPYTIVAWTKRDAAGHRDGIIGRDGITTFLYHNASNQIYFRANTISFSTADTTTAWQHVAVTVPSAPATVATFRNGINVVSTANAVAGAITQDRIGMAYDGTASRFFDGAIAVLGIAPGVLDIATLYAAGTFHCPLDPTVFTIACWNGRNEAGAGTALVDEAAGGNNGTFKGAGEPAWGGLMSVGGPAGWSDG